MSQHDYNVANDTGAAVRADINSALGAIVTNNSGAAAPATTFAYMWWPDTTTGLLKQRNALNSAWITIGTLASTNLGLASLAGGTFTGDVRIPNVTVGAEDGAGTISTDTSLAAGGQIQLFGSTGSGGVTNEVRILKDSTGIGFFNTTGVGVFGAPTFGFDLFKSSSGAAVTAAVRNTSNTASSDARFYAEVAGSSANDPFTLYTISGSINWSIGADNSDSDKFKICQSATLGTNDFFVIDASGLVSGTCIATQAQMETATATGALVSPGRLKYSPNAAKAWCSFNISGTNAASENVSSITDTGTGDWTVNLTTAFSTANFAATTSANPQTAGSANRCTGVLSQTASTIRIVCEDSSGSAADVSSGQIMVDAFGDQ